MRASRSVTAVTAVTALLACSLPAAGCSSDSGDSAGDHQATPALSSSDTPDTGSSGSAGSAGAAGAAGDAAAPHLGRVEVVRTLPHDPALFTEGLQVVDQTVYESAGMTARSQVLTYPLEGGSPTAVAQLPPEQFGEGLSLTPDGSELWTLTWRDHVAYRRDPATLTERGTASFEGEGWGLCAQPGRMVMSNGTDTLTFRDPQTFAPTGTVHVTVGGRPLTRINELDCQDGSVLANEWMTTSIHRIDTTTGAVTATYDASALEQPRPADPDAVLNGIAALPGTDQFLLTGKYWPHSYVVRFVD